MKNKIINFIGRGLATVSPVLATHYWYWGLFKRPLKLNKPVTLNEKLTWLKLHDYRKDPLVCQCADKYRVREYLEETGCAEILNEIYGAWDRVEDIPWEDLPDSFVLKCNHGCAYNILCPDKSKLDVEEAKTRLRKWMKEDFWQKHAEMQYKKIPKKIICEAFLGDGTPPVDYKIYCFHGKASYILACIERDAGKPKFYFFDHAWNLCPITKDGKRAEPGFTVEKPANLDKMLEYAEILSKPFPFVRVDFYYVKDRIVFGELTFTPSGALDTDRLPETDLLFGSMLHLPMEHSEKNAE